MKLRVTCSASGCRTYSTATSSTDCNTAKDVKYGRTNPPTKANTRQDRRMGMVNATGQGLLSMSENSKKETSTDTDSSFGRMGTTMTGCGKTTKYQVLECSLGPTG